MTMPELQSAIEALHFLALEHNHDVHCPPDDKPGKNQHERTEWYKTLNDLREMTYCPFALLVANEIQDLLYTTIP
jgi:hypothetical protein